MITVDGKHLDDYAVEALVELRNCQPPRDRLKYLDVAIESIVNPTSRVRMVQKLYEDLIANSDVDFGNIPESKGDFTRYKHYKVMTNMIESFDKLATKDKVSEIQLCEGLYNMLIECRSDFEYGYKFDIELIKICYCTLVISLHRLLDLVIMRVVEASKEMNGFNFQTDHTKCDNLMIVQSVKGILKCYDKGEWTNMIVSFKKGRNNFLGPLGAAFSAGKLITISKGTVELTSGGAAAFGVLCLMVIILLIRKAIYFFYSSAYKINDSVTRYRTFLEYAMSNETNEAAKIKQKAFLDKLDRVHDVIENKVFVDDTKAAKNLEKKNRERFSLGNITPENVDKAAIYADDIDASTSTPVSVNTSDTKPVEDQSTSAGNFSIF